MFIFTLRKVPILDWMLILIALCSIFVVYLSFRREVRYITVTFKVTDESYMNSYKVVPNEFADNIVKNDTIKDGLGRVAAEIEDTHKYNTDPYNKVVYVDIKLKALYDPRADQYSYYGRPLVSGVSHKFTFSKSEFNGIVVDIPSRHKTGEVIYSESVVKARIYDNSRNYSDIYGVQEYITKTLFKGKKATDNNGDVVAQIEDLTIMPAKRTIIRMDGETVIADDPLLKDVYLTIRLKTRLSNNTKYMFNFVPLEVGVILPLNFGDVNIWTTITEIVQ